MGIELAGHQQTNTGYTIPMPDLTGLPPEAGPVLDLMQQNQPMVIVAGTVGITALSEDERRALLAEIDVADALARAADIQAQWDVASTTHWNLKPLHLDLLLPASDDWMPAVRAEVNKGNIFAAPPQVMVQFMRELLEADSTASRKLAADELVRLLISIATEQQLNAEFKSDTPTPPAEFRALDEKYKAMTPPEVLQSVLHQALHDQSAAALFNTPRKIECLKADAFDFWYSPWAARVHDSLGAAPAETFKDATGIAIDDFLRAGVAVAKAIGAGQTVVSLNDLTDDERMRSYIAENMALDLSGYREQLAADRARGDVKLQRYTFTRYPFLDLGDGNLLILRANWATERFFGDPAQLDVMAAFTSEGDKTSVKRFNEGIKYQSRTLWEAPSPASRREAQGSTPWSRNLSWKPNGLRRRGRSLRYVTGFYAPDRSRSWWTRHTIL